MKQLRAWLVRLMGIVPKAEREQELNAEIESHIEMQTEDNLRLGMTPKEARRAAILKLGGVESTKQAYRERRTIPVVETVLQDLRFATRQLRKNPGFAVTAVLMIAVGMCASVAIFAFVDAALVKPLPYQDSTRLVAVTESMALFPQANLSYPDYLDWKKRNTVFQSMDVYTGQGSMLGTSDGVVPVQSTRISDGFFGTLGVHPILGRDFFAGEDLASAAKTTIISYAAWQERFGGRKDIVGQTAILSGVPFVIVGVLPKEFNFAPRGRVEFWMTLHPTAGCDLRRSCHGLYGVARLKDGVTVEGALANMSAIAQQLEREYPDSNRGMGASVLSLYEAIVGNIRPILLMLLGGAGLLLAIACINVASLLLVRSEGRRREIALRGALGATRSRLGRQFVTEGLLLVLVSSAIGLAAADGAMHLLLRMISKDLFAGMPFLDGLGMNAHVLEFAGAVALLATLVFSVTPMLRLYSLKLRDGLSEAGRGSAGTAWRRLGSNLVVLELAIAMVLLVGAGLLGKSFYRLLHVDIGFVPENLSTITINVSDQAYPKDEQNIALGRQIVSRIEGLPGVQSVGIIDVLPVSFNGNTNWVRFVGKPYNGVHNEVNGRTVSPAYFSTIGAKLARGRYFTDDEDASKPGVAIINEAFAKKYFPGEDPIGQRFGDTSLSPKSIREIVGVVKDVRDGSLDSEIWPAEYVPFSQDTGTYYYSVLVRSGQSAGTMLPMLQATIRKIDPGIGTVSEATMTDLINQSQTAYLHRMTTWLVGGFAAIALLLGAVGLYGVIAYSVSQRTREIGVRMALGAQRQAVQRMILKEAGWLAVFGVGLGLVGSVGAATLMRTMLFGVSAWDVQTIAGVACVLGVAALLASYIPAHRAASVEPMLALRAE